MARPLKEIRESMIRKSRKGSAITSNQRHYRKGERDAANRIADYVEKFLTPWVTYRFVVELDKDIREGRWRE